MPYENRSFVHPDDLHDRATCKCTRCTGFLPGHKITAGKARLDLSLHGSLASPLVLAPKAEAIAEIVRPLMPVPHPSFEGTLQSYCILLARIQRAHDALEAAEALPEGEEPKFSVPALSDELRRWQAAALKHASELGLTPVSAAKILKDAEIGKLAQTMQLTREKAEGVPRPALERVRDALREALVEADVVDAE